MEEDKVEASPRHHDGASALIATRFLAAQPDAVLCRLAARGNVAAYDTLYERYRAPLVAFAFHLLGRGGSSEDAEDIAQDAFTRAFAGIREKNVDGSFKAWLYTIARNRAYDTMRARKGNVVSLDAESIAPPSAPAADQPAERAEQRAELAWLLGAVGELPERQRDALLLKEMGGLSHDRIASEMGTTVSATKKLISRGREGIDEAAASQGYGRRRHLGRDLALAAPVLPLSVSLASLGVGAGAGAGVAAGSAVAGAGGVAAGKIAATALTVVAVGGGAVAVEHKRSEAPPPQVRSIEGAMPGADRPASLLGVKARPVRADDHGRGRGRDDGAPDDSRGRGRGGEAEPGDDGGRNRGGERSGRSGGGDEDSGGKGRGRGRSGGDDDAPPAGGQQIPTEAGDDSGGHSGGGESGKSKPSGGDDSSGSGSGNSGPGGDSGRDSGRDSVEDD